MARLACFVVCRLALIPLVVGSAVIIAAVVVLGHLPEMASGAADYLLTNASAPSDREMPPTAHGFSYAATDIQVVGGQGLELGCSIPAWIERNVMPPRKGHASILLRMRQACVFHDYCYRHGAATYNYGQADCDYMLLEQAYRTCRFINGDKNASQCIADAREVLLGVRLGGRNSFKRADYKANERDIVGDTKCRVGNGLFDDHCTSSYFEYDPYPVRSRKYVVYRLADTPVPWRAAGILAKSLYVFEIRPGGTRVTLVAWNANLKVAHCAGYVLPGSFDALNVAPIVVASKENGIIVDRFIWWHRYDLDRTGGRLATLAPAHAVLDDWQLIFPGAYEFAPDDCDHHPPAAAKPHPAASSMIYPGDARVPNASGKPLKDDLNFSELHPAPGLEPQEGFRLMALQTHTCVGAKTNILCYQDLEIDPHSLREKPPESYVARDAINRSESDSDASDPDRYRNFVSPPIPLAGDGAAPVLAWLRRGEKEGETFRETALLRRVSHVGDRGVDAGLVRLADFPESAEPVLVLARTSAAPALVSVRSSGREPLAIGLWRLPPVGLPPETDGAHPCSYDPGVPGELTRRARSVACRTDVTGCTGDLDDTWMIRPPVLDASSEPARLSFFRMLADGGEQKRDQPLIEAKTILLGSDGACVGADVERYGSAFPDLPIPNLSQREERLRNAVTEIRARPMLLGNLGEGTRVVIMPDPRKPSATFLALSR